MDTSEKLHFLVTDFPAKLATLQSEQEGLWGKMNALQMVCHFCDVMRLAAGKFSIPSPLTADQLAANYAFMITDKPFKENTPNPAMPTTPAPPRYSTMEQAISVLKHETECFVQAYKDQPNRKIPSPFFGELNYSDSVQLQHKHALHHLKQFGIVG